MARRQRTNVDYFPHDTHHCKTLRIINKKYGNDGYAFYFKLRELLGKTDYHNYDLSNKIDWQDFVVEMDIDEAKANELIEFLVSLGELDQEMWEEEKRLWSQNLLDDIKTVYNKRASETPDKYSFRTGNAGFSSGNGVLLAGNTQSKGKESKLKESRVVNDATTFDLDYFVTAFPQVDIHKSYKIFKLNQLKNGYESKNESAEFEIWVLRDIENEWNLRAPESNMGIETGDTLLTVYCPYCDATREVNRGKEAREAICQCGNQMWSKNEYHHEKIMLQKSNKKTTAEVEPLPF